MKKKSNTKLSTGEMEIMSVLWEHGPLTLSEAHEKLGRPIGYTTVQTRLNRLVEKGIATRSKERPAKYEAAVSPEDVSANHLNVLVDRVTGGSHSHKIRPDDGNDFSRINIIFKDKKTSDSRP